ncbi:unnamed protein product, partial [marine sediment metagenome]
LLRKDPYAIGALPDGIKPDVKTIKTDEESFLPADLSLQQAFRTRSFWVVIFIWVLMAFCVLLVLTHVVPHTTDIGFSDGQAAAVFSLIGGTRAAGMVLMGGVADRIGRKKTTIICSLFQAGSMMWLLWAQDLWMLYMFALVYGFTGGGLLSGITALIGDSFGSANIGKVLGVLDIGWAIGAASGPFIGGLIFDVFSSYSVAFFIGAAAMLIATLLLASIRQETNRHF